MLGVKRDLRLWLAMLMCGWLGGIVCSPVALTGSQQGLEFAQYQPRAFDSRPADGPPTPAPRTSSGGTMVLPRVPYDNRLDPSRRYVPERRLRRTPDSQRVVPKPPLAGGDPARFFDPPAENALSCETLRRLAARTSRQYWVRRYERCIGAN
ncbi:MAG: hypothetical protein K2Q28_11035 [Hyphomicrobium sp.]|nr:hypothetical protein [Hyphomicrobium sp.]